MQRTRTLTTDTLIYTAEVAQLFGIGWGLVDNGFLLWLPTNLRAVGLEVGAADRLLADAALIGFPATFVAAWLSGFWSSKCTMILSAILSATLSAVTLAVFAVLGGDVGDHPSC